MVPKNAEVGGAVHKQKIPGERKSSLRRRGTNLVQNPQYNIKCALKRRRQQKINTLIFQTLDIIKEIGRKGEATGLDLSLHEYERGCG